MLEAAAVQAGSIPKTAKIPQPDNQGRSSTAAAYAVQSESESQATASSGELVIQIPFDRLSERGMITPQAPRAQIAEEYRAIKRPLLMNISGRGATKVDHSNLIMVTSALQGDGKTFSAINLALSIAMEQDKTVLLVDADVSKASAGNMLGVPDSQPGLIDILEGKGLTVRDAILKTNISNLRILPAGNLHERSTELLASERMRQLMQELSERYSDRVIVFDSPPLLLTSEAAVLSNVMGQIVFVVGAASTPQSAVKDAVGRLGEDKVIGMVLNRASRSRLGSYNKGYGYGYGYGYGEGEGARKGSETD